MKVTFSLRTPNAQNESKVYARVYYSGIEVKYTLPDLPKIEPNLWNIKKQSAVQSLAKFPNYAEFNQRLNEIKTLIEGTILDLTRANQNHTPPTPEVLRQNLDSILKKVPLVAEKKEHTFITFFEDFISRSINGTRLNDSKGTPISKGTIASYKTTFGYISKFWGKKRAKLTFDKIDISFYEDFKEFLTIELLLSTNTIGKQIKNLKVVLNDATELEINANRTFQNKRFKRPTEETDNIYLNEIELQQWANLDLSNAEQYIEYTESINDTEITKRAYYHTLEKVRDLFLIATATGMRFSDFTTIKVNDITKDGILEFRQYKTKDKVQVHFDDRALAIIDKYKGNLPEPVSNQKMNMYLKLIGQLIPQFHDKIETKITKGGKLDIQYKKKYELVSTHTARRSFATNEYNAGTPTITIMAITGHKTEKSFLNYIKATPADHAKKLKELRIERKNKIISMVS